jgi:hypothetical protein
VEALLLNFILENLEESLLFPAYDFRTAFGEFREYLAFLADLKPRLAFSFSISCSTEIPIL